MASLISRSDSSLLAWRNPQVLMTIASASAASAVIANPSWASRPSMRSLSTRFLGQPKLTKATERIGDLEALPLAAIIFNSNANCVVRQPYRNLLHVKRDKLCSQKE